MLPASPQDAPIPGNALSRDQLALAFQQADLPKTWPDRSGLRLLWSLLKAPFVRGGKVSVPEGLPGPPIPEYARRPFHGLPNGYYSNNVAEGYDRGFEISMLGRVKPARERMIGALCNDRTVRTALDIGCGSGRLANSLKRGGVEEVWGMDPSPYLLQIAKQRTPHAHFAQGTVEETGFSDKYFDAVGACFLFHELPSDAASAGLKELHRIMKPGATLVITDPSRDHARPESYIQLIRKHGPLALYFNLLSRSVYEPYVDDWHSIESHQTWLEKHGFKLLEKTVRVPFLSLVAERI